MSKHAEFHTDISYGGKYFQLTFITNDKTQFLEMQELARKFIDQNREENTKDELRRKSTGI